ncbi:hypothetical protein CK203_044082 [Vitis vinifera]|uniref:Retrotransposon gag domain-containing protein n=1 Tax=Vitis vinifera TaxID=29760 RepID=A0A438HM46_VITVI|nr:hypothetical protein CK203_044082 [Vitis vinifera]
MYGSILEEPPGMRGSACVEVMTTLHGSARLFRGVQRVAYRRRGSVCRPSLGSVPWVEWESRHVVLEGTPSDIVTPPALPIQMPATQTLHTISHDRAAVVPPIVTPVTIVGDPRSRMDRLERRIGQMRDPDEMILWDDLDDVPVATLPVGFRMPDIERYTGVGCPRIHLRLYSTRWYASLETSRRRTWEDLAQEFLRQYSFSGDTSITRRELESLRQGSDESVSSFISRWREKAVEMIERPTERDQMGMFLRSLHPRFARHLTGVPFQDFRSLVQALLDVDDGLSRGLWSDIIPSPDTEGKGVGGSSEGYGGICSADFQYRRLGYHPYARSLQIPRSDFPPLQHRHPHSVQQYPSVHPHTVTVRPSFHFQRPQTSIPRHEQSRPHRRRQRTYSDLGMPLDKAFERLRSTGVLVPLAPRPLPSTLPPRFVLTSSVHFTRWQATVLIIVLLYVIPYRILLTVVLVLDSFSVVTGPRAEIDGMMVMIFSEYLEIRLRQLKFTMSDEIAPITLTTLYEMMVDLTRRVERIELILSEYPSSSRGAPGVAMPSLPHLTPSMFDTLGASHPQPRPHSVFQQHSSSISLATPTRPPSRLRGPPAMGFLAPLAPRALPDPVPPQFRLDLYCAYHQSAGHHTDRCTALRHAIQDIVDSGTFGHPQSNMFPIPTQLRPCMQIPLHQQSLILLIWAIDS